MGNNTEKPIVISFEIMVVEQPDTAAACDAAAAASSTAWRLRHIHRIKQRLSASDDFTVEQLYFCSFRLSIAGDGSEKEIGE